MTIRTHAQLQTDFADNSTNAIVESDLRNFVDSAMLAVDSQSPVATGINAEAGKHYHITMANMTSDISFVLPVATVVGERIRVSILDGNASYELSLKGKLIGAVKINNGSPGAEWSRLFIAGESVLFESTSTTNWNVVQDGRTPCSAKMVRNTTETINADAWEQIDYNESIVDRGGLVDLTNNEMVVRRDGTYFVAGYVEMGGPFSDGERLFISAAIDNVIDTDNRLSAGSAGATAAYGISGGTLLDLTAGQTVDIQMYHTDGTSQTLNNAVQSLMEVLG